MKYEMMNQFLRKLKSCSRVVFKKDVLDLPERTFNIREVALDPAETKAHKEMKRELYTLFKDIEFVAANAAVKIMKLREITSGFIKQEDIVMTIGESKLKGLVALLEDIGDHPVIIWTQFHEEGDCIEKFFRKYNAVVSNTKKIIWGRYDGTVTHSQKDKAIEDFISKKTQYIIAHPKSMGHGVDGLQAVCSYAIHFSISYSFDEDYQSNDRIYRKGQSNKCTYYYLLANNSIDPVIYSAIRAKQDASIAVLNYIKGKINFVPFKKESPTKKSLPIDTDKQRRINEMFK